MTIVTNVPSPVGIDYSPAQQAMIVNLNYDGQAPTSFAILRTNGVFSPWSDISILFVESKLATVKITTSGFTAGDAYFGNGQYGGIGWISSDASSSDKNWLTALTNHNGIATGLYVDQTHIWSNDLLAVTSGDSYANVWQIHSRTNYQMLASFAAAAAEGIVSIPNDPRYGPFAAKILVGDEEENFIHTIDPSGFVLHNQFGIGADGCYIIPANQDLYCDAYLPGQSSALLKVSKNWFTNYIGDILVEQAGEVPGQVPELFILHWNTNNQYFEKHGIPLQDSIHNGSFFEKVSFAPVAIP